MHSRGGVISASGLHDLLSHLVGQLGALQHVVPARLGGAGPVVHGHPAPQVGRRGQVGERGGQAGVAGGEQPVDVGTDEVGDAGLPARDHRDSGAPGLQGRDAEGLEDGGCDVDVGPPVELADLLPLQPADELHRAGEAEPVDLALEAPSLRTVPDDEHLQPDVRGQLGPRPPDDAQQGARTLARGQAHHADDEDVVRIAVDRVDLPGPGLHAVGEDGDLARGRHDRPQRLGGELTHGAPLHAPAAPGDQPVRDPVQGRGPPPERVQRGHNRHAGTRRRSDGEDRERREHRQMRVNDVGGLVGVEAVHRGVRAAYPPPRNAHPVHDRLGIARPRRVGAWWCRKVGAWRVGAAQIGAWRVGAWRVGERGREVGERGREVGARGAGEDMHLVTGLHLAHRQVVDLDLDATLLGQVRVTHVQDPHRI
jgi:hypothetical protein